MYLDSLSLIQHIGDISLQFAVNTFEQILTRYYNIEVLRTSCCKAFEQHPKIALRRKPAVRCLPSRIKTIDLLFLQIK